MCCSNPGAIQPIKRQLFTVKPNLGEWLPGLRTNSAKINHFGPSSLYGNSVR